MPLYDLFLLLDPGAPSDRHQTILRDVQSLLESDGKLVGAHEWGTRRMTFEIDHRPDAAYHLFQFEAGEGGELLNRVDHALKITDGVLRHRIIRLKDGSPPPPMPRQEGRGYGAEGEMHAEAAVAPDAEAAPAAPEAVPAAAEAVPAAAETPAPVADAPAADAEAPVADTPAPVGDDAAPAAAEAAPADAAPAEAVETAAPDASSLPAEPEAAEPAAEPAPADGEPEAQS